MSVRDSVEEYHEFLRFLQEYLDSSATDPFMVGIVKDVSFLNEKDAIADVACCGGEISYVLFNDVASKYDLHKKEKKMKEMIERFDFKTADEVLLYGKAIPVVSIGGMGPEYEDACQTIMLRLWKFLDDNPDIAKDILENDNFKKYERDVFLNLVEDIEPTGSMFYSALFHALYIKRHGYMKWLHDGSKEALGGNPNRIIVWEPHIKWEEKKERDVSDAEGPYPIDSVLIKRSDILKAYEEAIDEVKNKDIWPTDIYPDITKEDLEKIKAMDWPVPMERFYTSGSRHGYAVCLYELEKAIKENLEDLEGDEE